MKFNQLVIQHSQLLNENDRFIADFILQNRQCYHWTISEFSNTCLVSKSSVTRFCQKIGLSGFAQLKALLKWEDQDSIETDLSSLVKGNYEKMIETILGLSLESLFEDIYRAKRIILYGTGIRQDRVISEFKRIFLPTKKTILCISGYEMADACAQVVTKEDMVIIVSLSGEKKGVIELAKYLKIINIPTLSITRMQTNVLSSNCRYALFVNSVTLPKEYEIEHEIITPYFMLIEILYILYQRYIANVHRFNN